MKKFYVIFFAGCILFSILLYFPIAWFLGGLALLLIFIVYQFYTSRLRYAESNNELLEQQMEELQVQLDNSIGKEQKATKDAEQVRQLKQGLLTIISHEIRTPMNGVMGMASLLSETSLTKEQQEYADTIRDSGESLLTTINDILVNDLLNFSKLQQEGTQLEYKDLDLRNCVEEVLEMFAGKAGKVNLDLVYYIEEDVPAQILGDSKRLRQILMNLVENAVKFTGSGDVFVGIHSIKKTAGSSPELCFEVRDTGIGIANGQLMQLFKGISAKEFQKDTETGVPGLGLVICRKLVEMMGGNIEVRSQPGQGSTFTFSIPVTPSLKITRNQAQITNMAILEGRKILVVDDNQTSRLTLLKQMQSWKMLPAGADSAKEALDLLLKSGFEGVLVDRNMPAMDGIQLARTIRDQYPKIPVILMNPMGDELYKQESGLFSSVLTKPVRQFALRDHLLDIFSVAAGQPIAGKNLSEDFSKQYPMRILVAEDNLINQKIAIKILTKLGYQPALANNGKEVMEMIGHEHYDMILMDVQMPEMDGLVATRMIRTCLEIQPVIIAMTANVMQGDRDECMQAGMDDYLSKPIDMKELLSQLEKWGLAITNKRKVPD